MLGATPVQSVCLVYITGSNISLATSSTATSDRSKERLLLPVHTHSLLSVHGQVVHDQTESVYDCVEFSFRRCRTTRSSCSLIVLRDELH